MAVASGSLRSSLNPNAPLFIPAALQQVEDFSPEWWNLVQTNGWFREHWLQEHQELEKAEDDVANLLPETFDVGFEDEMFNFDDLDGDAVFHQAFTAVGGEPYFPQKQTKPQNVDVGAVLRTVNLTSPRYVRESPKLRENFSQAVSPKPSPRRMIIQQPR